MTTIIERLEALEAANPSALATRVEVVENGLATMQEAAGTAASATDLSALVARVTALETELGSDPAPAPAPSAPAVPEANQG